MRAITLMYHDVIAGDRHDASGFRSSSLSGYELDAKEFEQHLSAINAALQAPFRPATVTELLNPSCNGIPVLLTFDDGRDTATETAERLERFGWRGHFFVLSDFIGRSEFLDKSQMRDLHRRGHVIGTHSASHPERISSLPRAEMLREWRVSADIIGEILGERVRTGSVPHGDYSRHVGETARAAGIEALFTSQPRTRVARVDGCLVLGRYHVHGGVDPALPAALASGKLAPALRQALLWNAKSVLKTVGGDYYLQARKALLRWFD